jgi:hypothetical protein
VSLVAGNDSDEQRLFNARRKTIRVKVPGVFPGAGYIRQQSRRHLGIARNVLNVDNHRTAPSAGSALE